MSLYFFGLIIHVFLCRNYLFLIFFSFLQTLYFLTRIISPSLSTLTHRTCFSFKKWKEFGKNFEEKYVNARCKNARKMKCIFFMAKKVVLFKPFQRKKRPGMNIASLQILSTFNHCLLINFVFSFSLFLQSLCRLLFVVGFWEPLI
jgi:hypothetical protein